MQRREKILLIGLGVVMLLFVGRAARDRYTGALEKKSNQISNLEAKLSDIESEHLEAIAGLEKWAAAGAQTLSMEPTEATARLRDDLYELVRTAGLGGEDVNVGQVTGFMRNGIRMLNATITAEGGIDSMVDFLFRLYRRPYAVRSKTLFIQQVGGQTPPGKLRMRLTIETPILPANRMMGDIVPAVLDPAESREVDERLQYADAASYRTIVERNMWRPWEPPLPPPAKAANPNPANNSNVNPNANLAWPAVADASSYEVYFGASPDELEMRGSQPATMFRPPGLEIGNRYYWRVDTVNASGTTQGDVWSFKVQEQLVAAPPPPPPSPPPPPPPDGHLVLNRVLSSPRGQQAVAEDQRQPNNPNAEAKRYEVGETLFGGTLVYVHPRGVVSELNGVRRFHALGEQLQAHRPLTEDEEPQVYHEVLKLEQQAEGISQAPG